MTNNSSGYVKVLLVRHGQTDWNREKRFLGHTDQPLNSIGHAQAEQFKDNLPFEITAIYSSPLQRAYQTARTIGPKPVVINDLVELNQGQLEGLRPAEAIRRFPDFFSNWSTDPQNARVPRGETLGECQQRGLGAIRNILGQHKYNEVILIVSHQLLLASVLCKLASRPLTDWKSFRFENLGAAMLEVTPNGLEILEKRWKP